MKSILGFAFAVLLGLCLEARGQTCMHALRSGHSESHTESSILSIKTRSENGTGFIIDLENGYVLTAAHVIRDNLLDTSSVITATSPLLPDVTFTMEIVETRFNPRGEVPLHDVALLQCVSHPWSKFKSYFSQLDIAFETINSGVPLHTCGLPGLGSDPSHDKPVLDRKLADGTFLFKHAVEPGESGSPLMNQSGNVVGICIKEENVMQARYVLSLDFMDLFKNLPYGKLMDEIDQKFLSDSLDAQTLCGMLEPNKLPAMRVRNYDLFLWSYKMIKNKKAYFEDRNVLFLTVFNASIWRGVGQCFFPILGRDVAARQMYKLGKAMLMSSDTLVEQASTVLAAANTMYSEILEGYMRSNRSVLTALTGQQLIERSLLAEGSILKIGEIAILAKETKTTSKISNMYLAQLLEENSLTSLYLGVVSSNHELRRQFLDNARAYSIVSIAMSDNEAIKAMSYSTLGKVFYHQRNYDAASTALSTAWDLGHQEQWVKESYDFISLRKLKDKIQPIGIATFESVDGLRKWADFSVITPGGE